jgi:hypothetical protein
MTAPLTTAESRLCDLIRVKDRALRAYIADHDLAEQPDAKQWLGYLAGIKDVLGKINNDIGFIATLLIKSYLASRFSISDFDAGVKAQGASRNAVASNPRAPHLITRFSVCSHAALLTCLACTGQAA